MYKIPSQWICDAAGEIWIQMSWIMDERQQEV